jgi:hypothetical protein
MNMKAKLLLNSLYGRFGMKDDLPITTIIKKDEYSSCVKKHGEDNLNNIIDLGNHQLLQFKDKNNLEGCSARKDSFKGVNVNIAIASAVTAYARVYMSPPFSFIAKDPSPKERVATQGRGARIILH